MELIFYLQLLMRHIVFPLSYGQAMTMLSIGPFFTRKQRMVVETSRCTGTCTLRSMCGILVSRRL